MHDKNASFDAKTIGEMAYSIVRELTYQALHTSAESEQQTARFSPLVEF